MRAKAGLPGEALGILGEIVRIGGREARGEPVGPARIVDQLGVPVMSLFVEACARGTHGVRDRLEIDSQLARSGVDLHSESIACDGSGCIGDCLPSVLHATDRR